MASESSAYADPDMRRKEQSRQKDESAREHSADARDQCGKKGQTAFEGLIEMIRFRHRGSFSKTERFLNRVKRNKYLNDLDDYAQMGVEALAAATPVDSGITASSWSYIIERDDQYTRISWTNSNVNEGVNIAVILQYGHGTGTGGFVAGQDYINPAMQPIFDTIAEGVWKEVTGK